MGKSAGLSPLRRPALTPTWRRASARLVRTDQPARLSISHDRLRTNAIGGIDQYRNPSCAGRQLAQEFAPLSANSSIKNDARGRGWRQGRVWARCRGPRLPHRLLLRACRERPTAAALPPLPSSGASIALMNYRISRSTDNQLRSGRRYRTRRSLCERVNLSNSLEKVFASEVVNTDSSRVRTRSTSGSARSRRSSPAFVNRNK